MQTISRAGVEHAHDTTDPYVVAADSTVDPVVMRHAATLLDLFDHLRLGPEQVEHMCLNAVTGDDLHPDAPRVYRLAARVANLPMQGPVPAPPVARYVQRAGCGWCALEDQVVEFRVHWERTDHITVDGDESCCAHCLPEVIRHANTDPFRSDRGTVEVDDLTDNPPAAATAAAAVLPGICDVLVGVNGPCDTTLRPNGTCPACVERARADENLDPEDRPSVTAR